MDTNRIFKTCNSYVFIGYERLHESFLRRNWHNGLRTIHVFTFFEGDIDAERLAETSRVCREAKVKLILHGFDKHVLGYAKHELKGVEKDKWFHLSLVKTEAFMIAISEKKTLYIKDREAILCTAR